MKELQLNDGLRGNGGLHQCRQASLILQLSVWGVQSGWQADQRCQNLQHMGSKMLWLVFIKKKAGRRDPQKMLSVKLIGFLNCSISSSVILKELLPLNLEKTETFDIKIIQLPSDCHNNYAALTRFL